MVARTEDFGLADLRHMVERILRRHELIGNARSSFGSHLDVLRASADHVTSAPRAAERAGYLWARAEKADRNHDEFAYLCFLAALLSPEEYEVLESYYTPASPEELADRKPLAQTNERVRSVWRADVLYEEVMGNLMHYRTLAGEDVIHDCNGDPSCEVKECTHDPDRVLVSSPMPKMPYRSEVALRLGISVYQVARLVRSGHSKIRRSIEERALRRCIDGSADG